MLYMSAAHRKGNPNPTVKPQDNIDADTMSDAATLPHIDEHMTTICGDDPERVWNALGAVLERFWRVPRTGTRLLRAEPATRAGNPLVAGSALPAFNVTRAEPGRELALEGHHRFSLYALIFRLIPGEDHITLTAETRAAFPGVSGRAYRWLVIGTRGHILVVRALLRATRKRAERG